ncbi:uncharacterized protein LOC134255992 [Saccostrea cucullata]|uniref:uncharacterized protein LOC134255992 n=1 Tax=Saccostrea cuccullata TaxID=36930 RepID=UPI002ED514CB
MYTKNISHGRKKNSLQLIIDDLSFRKPTNQTHGYDAGYTVDGNHSTCMDTVNGFPVTWYLDLQEVKSIAKIWIFYKTSAVNGRFVYNYKMYLSNTTRWIDGFPCISDPGPSAALPGTVKDCPTIARYVIFHNTKESDSSLNFSSVCDVKVEGCQKNGVFGSYCDKPPHPILIS